MKITGLATTVISSFSRRSDLVRQHSLAPSWRNTLSLAALLLAARLRDCREQRPKRRRCENGFGQCDRNRSRMDFCGRRGPFEVEPVIGT